MKYFYKAFLFLLFLLLIQSCGTKKNTFVSRNFQALTTKYNVLFNGKEAFKKGLKEIQDKHQDNFWKRLSIEPISFDEDKVQTIDFGFATDDDTPKSNASNFDKAEEKATKAIQKHSMNFDGIERNRQIDDAYLLLGKSRYYTQRFIPAIDAFNYVILNYPEANLIDETKIWRAKTNIRLGNEKTAIETLKLLLKNKENEKKLSESLLEQIHTTLAMAYEKTDTIQKVIKHLSKASKTFKNREQSARNMFILGQVYSEQNKKDSARIVFKKLSETKKASRKYKIHANIAFVKNVEQNSSSKEFIQKLKRMIRNSDNVKYLDQLYYQTGVLEQNRDSINKAIEYYNKSLKSENGTPYQKTYSYEKLGNIYFDKSDYIVAGFYYDSVMKAVPEEYKNEIRIRRIKKKAKALTTLREYENIIKQNDSILSLTKMSKKEQESFFNKHIAKLKKKDEEQKQQEENIKNLGNQFSGSNIGFQINQNKGKWYFYNIQTISYGKTEFKRYWGNRPLEDNWRYSNKSALSETEKIKTKESKEEETKKYDLNAYLEKIPTEKTAIDSLKTQRNEALYQLGLIYKEQFKDSNKAIENLTKLLRLNSDENMILPINYHLYQLYLIDNKQKANYHKNIIIVNYPESKFAQIIQNPNKKIKITKTDNANEKYKEVYYTFKQEKFDETIDLINKVLPLVQKSELLPKFELLKAYATGKTKSKEEYLKALEFVAYGFSSTEEGKKAKEIINKLRK